MKQRAREKRERDEVHSHKAEVRGQQVEGADSVYPDTE